MKIRSDHDISVNDLQMRDLFIAWFDEVKNMREVNRTRVCGNNQRKERERAAAMVFNSLNKHIHPEGESL